MNVHQDPSLTPPERTPAPDFFGARWRGEVPLSQLFWRDMVVIGSLVNVVSTIAALLLLDLKFPLWTAIAMHLLPLPLNLFLFAAIWRTADRSARETALAARTGAAAWLLFATAA